ncbi:MAG: phage major capsid protein, partial [Firmicutes bacterium]|nr:phage major capsid protein [Bacillota bacterium]
MSKIIELREKRAKAWDAAKAFLDTKRGDNGLLSAEDTATYDKMEADVVALGKEIERLERQAVMDAELAKATSAPITNKPTGDSGEEKTGRASGEYKKSFWNAMRGRNTTVVLNALQVGTDSEGGYLVPEEFETRLVQSLEEENIIRQLVTVITTGGDRKIPVVAAKGTASWVDEEGAIPESDDSFGQISLGAFKLATMIKVSEELLNDSAFDLESYIAQGFGNRIGNREEEGFLAGNGTGKPTGVFNATGGAQVGVTTASATSITLDEVLDLFYSLKSPYRRNAAFIMNDATVKAIRKLKDSTGQYLWQPSIKEATPDTILSRRLYTSTYVP